MTKYKNKFRNYNEYKLYVGKWMEKGDYINIDELLGMGLLNEVTVRVEKEWGRYVAYKEMTEQDFNASKFVIKDVTGWIKWFYQNVTNRGTKGIK
jgi:hypothetical protein